MSDNSDFIPRYFPTNPMRTYMDSVINGAGNIVDPSAQNVIVNGDRNYVGGRASNVTILNSSGCVVNPDVVGAVIINSSGVTISDDNLVYINNVLVTNSSFGTGSYVSTAANGYSITSANETLEIRYTGSMGTYVLPSPLGHNRKYTIKNMSANDQEVLAYGYTIDDTTSGGAGRVTLGTLDSITVQSDGISNYIII